MSETKVTYNEIADDYSTNEVNTGRKWIDGKPIYRKTYVVSLPGSTATTTSFAHGVTGLDTITRLRATAIESNGNTAELSFYVNSTYWRYLRKVGANIGVEQGATAPAVTCYVTPEYTKT